MPDGFPNKPKILRGAFVEYGLSLPPLCVVFQFNPLQLTRKRSLTFGFPNPASPPPGHGAPTTQAPRRTLRQFHCRFSNLLDLQKQQIVTVGEQTIDFDIRLDATDKLNDEDIIATKFGIAPQIATLEQMVYPKDEGVAAKLLNDLKPSFSFTRGKNPPLILFIFGRKRVLPVNINSMNITETEFSSDLNPLRANVAVSLSVIEGKNAPFLYSKLILEELSALNLSDIANTSTVVLPG